MASHKEDQKNEKIIRGLLKQPANRKCVNCNSLGPQYVCITFWTFVCTNCSGIHREFTHRIKSVSMAKFTSQEVASLQARGNERAKEIYFKEWDPQWPPPDSSNVDRLRVFIKHVYEDRRYSGEKNIDRPPRVKMGDKEEVCDNRRLDAYQSGSRSPAYDDTYERCYSGRPSPGFDGRKSPGYDQDNQRDSDYGRSPVRPNIINDWRRDDRIASGSKSEDLRSSDGECQPDRRSPDQQKDMSSPPVVRPVREILGENVIPLRISEPPKATQRTPSSSSLVASSNANPVELKRETSLIDFDAVPAPPISAATTQTQQSTASQPVTHSTSTETNENWATFDNSSETKVSCAPPKVNPLESVLMELSAPAPVHVSGSSSSALTDAPSNGIWPSPTSVDSLLSSVGNMSTAPTSNALLFPTGVAPAAASQFSGLSSDPAGGVPAAAPGMLPTNGRTNQWPRMQHQQQPFSPNAVIHSAVQQSDASFGGVLVNQGVASNYVAQASTAAPNPSHAAFGAALQTGEVKLSGRRELPADLFTPTYPSVPYAAPGWQPGLVPGMGFPVYYNPAMALPSFPQPTKSTNPFDVNNRASPVQSAVFPSMTSLQAALPNMAAPTSFVHPSNLATSNWMPPQPPSYSSVPPSFPPSFAIAMPGTYPGQQLPSNMVHSRPQGVGSYASFGSTFGSLNANTDPGGNFSASATTNPSVARNPFG